MPLLALGLALAFALVALVAKDGRSRRGSCASSLGVEGQGVVKCRSLSVASFQDFSSAILNGRPCCAIVL